MIPTLANGQLAAAAYSRGRDGIDHACAIVVLTTTATGISRIVVFGDPGLFANSASRDGFPPSCRLRTAAHAAGQLLGAFGGLCASHNTHRSQAKPSVRICQ
jgi:hypothetical protein